jgi:hypothetical protein
VSTFTPITLDSSSLLNYYSSQLQTIAANAQNASASSAQSSSTGTPSTSFGQPVTTSSDGSTSSNSSQTPPWEQTSTLSTQALDAQVLGTTNFIQQSTTPLVGTSGTSKATQEDNQNLFTLYQAVSKLSTLASIASQAGTTSGELAGYNAQFQTGLQQVESFISGTTFNNLTLQAQNPTASVTGTAGVPLGAFQYNGGTIVNDSQYSDALSGVSTSDSFNIAVTKGGTTTNVPIDLSQVQGPLTISNIVNYANQELKADGFSSTFSVNMTSGSESDVQTATYGISVTPAPGETLSLSSASATPDLIVAGTSGSTTSSASTGAGQAATAADNQGVITALTNLSSSPTTLFNATEAPTTGTTTATQTVVDSQGNVYEIGNATGNMGSQLNQGSQDVYLTKYDSAGNLQWSELLGSAGSASGYSLALNPSTGGVVVSGSTTADLSPTAVTASLRLTTPTAISSGNSRSRRSRPTRPMPLPSTARATSISAARSTVRSARVRRIPAGTTPILRSWTARAISSPNSNSARLATIRSPPWRRPPTAMSWSRPCRTAKPCFPNMRAATSPAHPSGR